VQQPYDPAATAAALKAPEGTPVYNVWIWLVVFLPYVTLPLLFTIDIPGMMRDIMSAGSSSAMASLGFLTSPGYILLTLGGWLLSAATIFFSYRDYKWLEAAGVPKPFHWAYGFFMLAGYPVYAIGRAVVTKRRTGKGSAVLWVVIGMLVLTFIVVIIWTVVIMSSMFSVLSTYPGLR
jgi:hypothetical protein